MASKMQTLKSSTATLITAKDKAEKTESRAKGEGKDIVSAATMEAISAQSDHAMDKLARRLASKVAHNDALNEELGKEVKRKHESALAPRVVLKLVTSIFTPDELALMPAPGSEEKEGKLSNTPVDKYKRDAKGKNGNVKKPASFYATFADEFDVVRAIIKSRDTLQAKLDAKEIVGAASVTAIWQLADYKKWINNARSAIRSAMTVQYNVTQLQSADWSGNVGVELDFESDVSAFIILWSNEGKTQKDKDTARMDTMHRRTAADFKRLDLNAAMQNGGTWKALITTLAKGTGSSDDDNTDGFKLSGSTFGSALNLFNAFIDDPSNKVHITRTMSEKDNDDVLLSVQSIYIWAERQVRLNEARLTKLNEAARKIAEQDATEQDAA